VTLPSAVSRGGVDTIVSADEAVYHAWPLAESLRIASDKLAAPRQGGMARGVDCRERGNDSHNRQ
jgi:hypothetical protein